MPAPTPSLPEGAEPLEGCPHDWEGPFDWQGRAWIECRLCHWSLAYEEAPP